MVCDSWLVTSIRFVCFLFQGSLLCDRPISGNNRLVQFASQISMIFLILVNPKNKVAMPPSFDKTSSHHRDFDSFAILEKSRVILSQAGWARYIVVCINPRLHPTDWLNRKTRNPSKVCNTSSLQYDTTRKLGLLRQVRVSLGLCRHFWRISSTGNFYVSHEHSSMKALWLTKKKGNIGKLNTSILWLVKYSMRWYPFPETIKTRVGVIAPNWKTRFMVFSCWEILKIENDHIKKLKTILNPRRYTQSHTPAMVQEEGRRFDWTSPPPPWVFAMLQYFETILPSWESLWYSLQDEVYFMGGGGAWGLWRHQTLSPSWPPSWILSRVRNQVKQWELIIVCA